MTIAAMKQALDDFDAINKLAFANVIAAGSDDYFKIRTACCNNVKALRAAIEAAEECEPVAVAGKDYQRGDAVSFFTRCAIPMGTKLYTHPAPVPAWVLETAENLARHMAKEFFPDVTQFEVFDDLAGVISQIDNMVCGLPREPIDAVPAGMVLVKAASLLACRDALINKDADEAYHQLYWSVNWNDPYSPWLEWEAAAPKEMK